MKIRTKFDKCVIANNIFGQKLSKIFLSIIVF